MCLAVPVTINEIKEGNTALVEVEGVKVEVSTNLFPELKVGDYVLVHAGFIIDKIDKQEAEQTLSTFDEYHKILNTLEE